MLGAMNDGDSLKLNGKLLLAMPGMADLRFDRAVIFICAHSSEGSMGLIVNKAAPDVKIADLLNQLSIPLPKVTPNFRAHFGGPVEHGRGFVLHSADYKVKEATLEVDVDFAMTATLEILEQIAKGHGPQQAMLMLGYAGWGPGQLEGEIVHNGWLTCDATPELVFSSDSGQKWGAALKSLGIDPLTLSATAGRA